MGFSRQIKQKAIKAGAGIICEAIGEGSDENLSRFLHQMKGWNERLSRVTGYEFYEKDICELIDGLEGRRERHPTLNLFKAVLDLKSKNCRDSFMKNVVWNSGLEGNKIRTRYEKEKGFRPPYSIAVSPTMNCNLKCHGCSTGEFEKKSLSFQEVDGIVSQGKKIGAYFYIVIGGEPFVWKPFFDIIEKHNDAYFLVFSNGTLIDNKISEKIEKAGNIAVGVSIEGFEKETDEIRGKGTWKKAMGAMENLREYGVLYGFSTKATRKTSELVVSREFVELYYDKGARFSWYFQFMPVGRDADLDMMATPEQREFVRKRIKEIRQEKQDLYIGDFWGDGVLAGGCMAAGRKYIHINANGDIEPCSFVHFAVDNIKEKTLEQALDSEFFREIRKRQPYSKNLYAPCMIIDNPEVLREVVEKTKARPTHCGADNVIKDEKVKKYFDEYSRKLHKLSD